MDNNLKELSLSIFDDLKNNYSNYSAYGFNLSYSTEFTWKSSSEILILTLNPKAEKTDPYVPKNPYPSENIFFGEKNFKIKNAVGGLIYDLYTIFGNKYDKREFINNIILSSFVPFRTYNEKNITDDAWSYSYNMWKMIFNLYTPKIIINLGRNTFYKVKYIFDNKYTVGFNNEKRLSEYYIGKKLKTNFKFRIAKYKDNKLTLIGLPHPSGSYGYCGYHDNLPNDNNKLSPIGIFIQEIYNL